MNKLSNEIIQKLLNNFTTIKQRLEDGEDINITIVILETLVSYLSSLPEQGLKLTAEQVITKSLVESLMQINMSPLSKDEWLNFNEYLMGLSKLILQAALAEVNNGKDQKPTA